MSRTTDEAVKTDSKISAMRVAFFWMIKVIIGISIVVTAAKLVFVYLGKDFDITPFIYLVSALSVVAFGGKVGQSFSEGNVTMPEGFNSVTHAVGSTLGVQGTLTTTATTLGEPEDNR